MATVDEVLDKMLGRIDTLLDGDWSGSTTPAQDVQHLANAFATLLAAVFDLQDDEDDDDDLEWEEE